MPSFRQVGQQDGRMMRDAMREVSGMFEEQLIVNQWTGVTGGNPQHGITATDTYTTVQTRGNVSDLSAQDVFYSNNLYVMGDLRAELRIPVFGAISRTGEDGQAAGRKSDQVVYRGRTYYFVGHVNRIQEAGRVYWVGVLRQVGS